MKSIIVITALLVASVAHAERVDIHKGINMRGISVSSDPVWESGKLTMEWEGGLQRWKANGTSGYQLYVTPTFRWEFANGWYADAGVGVSVFNKTQFGNKDISTHFQFSDHIGISHAVGSYKFGVRYVHASNAGIKRPNPGMDSLHMTLSTEF